MNADVVGASGSFYEALFDNMNDGVYLIDPETSNILWVNRAGYKGLRMEKEEVLNQSVLSLQKNVVGKDQWKSIADVIHANRHFTFNGHHARQDGTIFPVEVITSCIQHNNQELFLSVARDISNRKMQESELLGHERNIWVALNASSDGLWNWNIQNNQVFFSPSLKRMLGYGPDEMQPVLDTWKNNVHPEDLPSVSQALQEHLNGKREKYEAVYRLKNRNGHFLWVFDVGCVSERDEQGNPIHITGIVRDITEYKMHELRLLELAAYDELTDLRNRRECSRIFDKQLEFAQRNEQPMSLLLFDLDFFKTVNDKYGHLAGDQVLKDIALLMTQHIRKSDYLFRWGGEEFILVCPNTTTEEVNILAEKLRQLIESHTITYKTTNIKITASFGIATYPQHGDNQEQLLLSADSALYTAKSQGRNCVICAEERPS